MERCESAPLQGDYWNLEYWRDIILETLQDRFWAVLRRVYPDRVRVEEDEEGFQTFLVKPKYRRWMPLRRVSIRDIRRTIGSWRDPIESFRQFWEGIAE